MLDLQSVKVSHLTIGWNNKDEFTIIPVLSRTYRNTMGDLVDQVETVYEAAVSRKATLYLVDEDDFLPYDRFEGFSINEQGLGLVDKKMSIWIVDHMLLSQSQVDMAYLLLHLEKLYEKTGTDSN